MGIVALYRLAQAQLFNVLGLRLSLSLALGPCRHWSKKCWELLFLLSLLPGRKVRMQ